jgi:hypothetical protein
MAAADVNPNRQLIFQGMDLFSKGDIQGSIAKFDASVPPDSRAYLWQRGISYYYNDQFALGSKQFRDDVLRSPLDVEEIVWDIACLLRMDPSTFPPKTMMSLPPGKTDRRPIMVRQRRESFLAIIDLSSPLQKKFCNRTHCIAFQSNEIGLRLGLNIKLSCSELIN